eukprot:GCRY01000332.1.p1 GENE.GCRY01000332.1~~GCRY01000332.1.p1  ORF type:complete len:223 (-),score=27.47 GCRY01000332.1:971-1639(-)
MLVVFDVDDCLYPASSGVNAEVRQNIFTFLKEKYGFSLEESQKLCMHYFQQYGLTLRGLNLNYDNVDDYEYLDFVHGRVDLSKLITPDPDLVQMIADLKAQGHVLAVFSNADKQHCERCFECLGLDKTLFDHFIEYHYLAKNSTCKPHARSYELVMQNAGFTDYREVVFLDDSGSNIDAAVKFGWTGIQVGEKARAKNPSYQISTITELRTIMPQLFGVNEE